MLFSLSLNLVGQKNAVNRNYHQDFNKAMRFFQSEKYEDAQDLLEDIPEQDSMYLEAQYRLQEIYLRTENFPKVVEVGKKMAALPYAWGHYVYFNWTIALGKMERHEEALRVIEEGLSKYSESHLLHYTHGCTLQDLKKHQEALRAFQRAVLAYPFHVYSHVKLGEIAANEGRYAQSIMSLTFATLLDIKPELKAKLHALLERVAVSDNSAESKDLVFDNGDDFSDIDRLIKSKIALSPKFKLKSKAKGFYYIRQLQVISESLRYDYQSDGFWMQFYGRMYQSAFHSDNFENLTFVSLAGPNYGKANSVANKNAKKRQQFFSWFGENFPENIGRQFTDFDGKRQMTYVEIGDYNVESRGLGTSYDNRKGVWQLYDGINGRPTGTGRYNDGKREGVWEIYDEVTGDLSMRITYENDKMNGAFKTYYPNGSVQLMINMKIDKREGDACMLFASGDTIVKDVYKNGARNGPHTRFWPDNSIKLTGTFSDNRWNGELKEYHTNGQLSGVYNYKNDERDGAFVTYHINGQVYQKGSHKVGKLVDDYEEYHNNGQLKTKGKYKNDNVVGRWVYYYYDGKLEDEMEFDESGKQNGIHKSYDRDGKIHYEMEYKNGELLAYKFFDKTGKVIAEEKRNGKKLNYKYYNPLGVLETEGTLENDEKTGLWIYYNEYGVKHKEHKYEKGKIVGKATTYFANGDVSIVEEYQDGLTHGLGMAYHPNGQIRMEGYFRKGLKTGMWYDYYPDGKLKEKEYYVEGELVGWSEDYAVSGLLAAKYFNEDEDISKIIYFDISGNSMDTVANYHGEVRILNPNGKDLVAKLMFKNDVRHGLSEDYFVNNKIKERCNYVNNKKHGLCVDYYEHGQINSIVKYVHGEIDSINTDYRMNGNVASRTPYKNGVINGTSENYHPDGKLHYKTDYVDNKKEGEVLMRLSSGEIYAVFYYANDLLVAYSYEDEQGKIKPRIPVKNDQEITCFFKNGQQSFSAKRKNGVWEGDYKIFNPKGEIIEHRQYASGYLHGESIFNLSGKQPYSVNNYTHGIRNGIMKIHHLNGNLMVESIYVHGKKHGEEKEYDKNGRHIITRVYYNDVMISETKI